MLRARCAERTCTGDIPRGTIPIKPIGVVTFGREFYFFGRLRDGFEQLPHPTHESWICPVQSFYESRDLESAPALWQTM